MERKFKIISVEEIKTKDGKKFNAYKTIGKGGRKLDVRFTKSCKNVPTEPCTIVVDEANANVDKSRLYPILWVKDIIRTEQNERGKNNISEFFDDDFSDVEEV